MREYLTNQVPFLTSKHWFYEMWLPEGEIQESPARHQDTYYFLDVSLNECLNPGSLTEVSVSKQWLRLDSMARRKSFLS